MKGILKSVYLMGMTGVVILAIAGCTQSIGGVSDTGVPKDNYNAVTETGATYQNLLSLTVNAVTKSVEKVVEYDENVMAQFNERSSAGRVFDLDDIYALTDIEKTKNVGARSAGGNDAGTLGDELAVIAAEFEKAVSEMAPTDLSFLDGVDGVIVENGLVYMDDDIIIDPATISGILQLNLIRAQFAGEDLNDIITDMDGVASSFDEDGSSAVARGIYKISTTRWPSKIVSYSWGNISASSKILFQNAMADWSAKIPGLTFIDRTNDKNYMPQAAVGNKPLVVLSSSPTLNAMGSAYVGAPYGKSHCTIKDGLTGIWAIRTPRHELGHTLGLEHEHQRWDRDTYLTFSASDASDTKNWAKIDKTVSRSVYGWYVSYLTFKICFIKVRVYYLAYGLLGTNITTVADGTPTLDYNSIMLYSSQQATSLKTKIAQQGFEANRPIPVNYQISAGDIATVKKMYP